MSEAIPRPARHSAKKLLNQPRAKIFKRILKVMKSAIDDLSKLYSEQQTGNNEYQISNLEIWQAKKRIKEKSLLNC